MKSVSEKPVRLPAYGTLVEFACGGLAPFEKDMPWVEYEGKILFFCLPECKRTFEREPKKFLAGAIPHFE
jgi:hypothetical protein